jgi:hypothetical protein
MDSGKCVGTIMLHATFFMRTLWGICNVKENNGFTANDFVATVA